MPTPTPDRPVSRCLNFPDRGVVPGSASRLPRWRSSERPAPPPRETTEFPASENAVPQADGVS